MLQTVHVLESNAIQIYPVRFIPNQRAPRAARKKSKDPSRGGDRGLRYASQGTRDALVGYLLPIPWAMLRYQYLTLVTFLQPNQVDDPQ
jgi:hypothetical protein